MLCKQNDYWSCLYLSFPFVFRGIYTPYTPLAKVSLAVVASLKAEKNSYKIERETIKIIVVEICKPI